RAHPSGARARDADTDPAALAALRLFRLQRRNRDRRSAQHEDHRRDAGLTSRQHNPRTARAARGPPSSFVTGSSAGSASLLSANFLPLKNHIADDEKNDRSGDHPNHLRPSDQDTLGEWQWRAQDRTLQLTEINRAERARGRV